MTRNQASQPNMRNIMGAVLLAIGSTALVAYSTALAWQFSAALNSTASDSLGFLGTIGLASLHAVRIVAQDHAVLLSVATRILLSCSALIVALIGLALLPKRVRVVTAPARDAVPTQPEGDQ